MLEALEYYQSLAQKFPSQLLTGPGILVVLAGLCIWLAGLRWRMIIGALAGASIAAVGVFAVGSYPVNVVLAACIIGLLAGVIVNRIVLGIFGTAAGALVVMVILAGSIAAAKNPQPVVEFHERDETYNSDKITADNFVPEYPTWPEYAIDDVSISAPAAVEITVKMTKYIIDSVKKMIASAGFICFAGGGVAAVIAVIAVLIVPRLFVAFVSSALGSMIIFAGMIMLLFYKNSKPINLIADKPQFYAAVFGAMVIFGTIVQLILSPSAFVKVLSADEEKGEKK